MLTAPDIYHTACPYPVELPDDLRRQEVYEEDLDLDLEMPEAPIEGFPHRCSKMSPTSRIRLSSTTRLHGR